MKLATTEILPLDEVGHEQPSQESISLDACLPVISVVIPVRNNPDACDCASIACPRRHFPSTK